MSTEWIIPAAGAGAGLLMLILFAWGWLGLRRRRLRRRAGTGDWGNAIGFGMLPSLMTAKAFEAHLAGSAGKALFRPVPEIPWLTENGLFAPDRIEMILFLAAFLGMCLWLIGRRNDFPPTGDLAGIAMTLWAAIRSVTEWLRAESRLSLAGWRVVYLLSMAVTLIWLALWTLQRQKRIKNTSQTVLYWLVTVIGSIGLWVIISGTLSTGSEIGDLAALAGCSAARAAAVLAAGAESRRG